jgi:hypothetical protein
MLMINRCSWAHCLLETARLLDVPEQHLLTSTELAAISGKANPQGNIIPFPGAESSIRARARATEGCGQRLFPAHFISSTAQQLCLRQTCGIALREESGDRIPFFEQVSQ